MSYLCPHPCEGKTEHGYCRYTWCINPLHSNLGTAQQGQGVKKQVITNADKLRAMSDEELALEMMAKGGCPHDCEEPEDMDTDCRLCWLDRLRKEITE